MSETDVVDRNGQLYRCPEGCEVQVEGFKTDMSEIAIDVTCLDHGKWMEPVPWEDS